MRIDKQALDGFEAGPWGQRYPAIAQSWRRNWSHVVPFFAFPESVRRMIYTTNAIEALNSKLRRAVRTRGHFPNDDAAMKLLYLVLNHAAADWKRAPREWTQARTQFAVVFGERFMGQYMLTGPAHKISDSPGYLIPRLPHPRSCFFKQAVFQGEVRHKDLHVPHLAAESRHLAGGRSSGGVSGQAAFAGLEELL